MATSRKWMKAVMRESFCGFTQGKTVYVRLAVTKRPLAVGPIYIMFDGKRSLRVVSELASIFRTEGPCENSLDVTKQYRRYIRQNPPAERYLEHEYLFA